MYIMTFLCSAYFLPLIQDGYSPLHAASEEGHANVVDSILKSGANPNLATEVWEVVLLINFSHI